MKRRLYFCSNTLAAGFSASLALGWSTMAAPSPNAAPAPAPQSVFIIPKNPQEGRDPFFPASIRPYAAMQATPQAHVADITSLVLKGVSGPADHRLAIINNRTFAVGDVQDLVTSQGRLRIHCVEIKADSVVVEFAGESHELKYTPNH